MTSKDAKNLLQRQLKVWELAKTNFDALNRVESKDISFGDFTIRVQFNPARIQSSAAKVDAKSIQERKCFLCSQNLPPQQEDIPFGEEYHVLVNPFPIFPEHYTVPTHAHTDQLILDKFGDMLDLAKSMDDCVVFYNGPKCGASAPDHAHFQVGNKGFLPLEKDVENLTLEAVYKSAGIVASKISAYLRNGFLIEATDKSEAVKFFKKLYAVLEIKEGEQEPMFNILAWYDKQNQTWMTFVFPRAKHRPSCYFEEGDANILISPASVDLGGVFITPLEKDFQKITKKDIEQILAEVCIGNEELDVITAKLTNL